MNEIGRRMRQQLLIATLLTIVYGFAAFGSLINRPINRYVLLVSKFYLTSMNCSSTFGSDSITWFFKPAVDGVYVTIASGSIVSRDFIPFYWIDQPTANESNLIISTPNNSTAGIFTCADKETVAHAQLLLAYNLNVSTNASDNLFSGDVVEYTCQLVYVENPFFIPIFYLERFPPVEDDLDNTTTPQLEQSGSVVTATATFYQRASCLSSLKTYACVQKFGQPVGYLAQEYAKNAPSASNGAAFQPVKVTCLSSTGDPLYGPIAGGTVVTLTLDNWSKQSSGISAVYLGGILQAIDLQSDRLSNIVEMTTPIATAELIGQPLPITIELLSAVKDKFVEVLPEPYNITTNLSFTYKDNPEITGISPSTFVVTGGTIVNVTGYLLTSVANPFIQVTIVVERGIERNTTSEKFVQPCEVQAEDGFQMTCRMPPVNIPDDFLQVLDVMYTNGYGRDNNSTPYPPTTYSTSTYPPSRRKRYANALFVTGQNGVDQLVISVGFILDGYKKYENINEVLPDTQILIFSPPEISFTQDIVEFDPDKDESISIKGMHMTRGCRIVDYMVQVGADVCENIDLTDNQLRCRPPKQQPQSTNNTSIYSNCDQLLGIYIRLGFKTYQYACMKYSTRPLALIIGLAVGLSSFVIIILLIITIVCCCKRSRNRSNKLTNDTLNINGASANEANEPPPSDHLNAAESYLQLSAKPYDYDAYIKPSEQSCVDEPYLRPSSKLYAEEEYESPSDQLYTNALELK